MNKAKCSTAKAAAVAAVMAVRRRRDTRRWENEGKGKEGGGHWQLQANGLGRTYQPSKAKRGSGEETSDSRVYK